MRLLGRSFHTLINNASFSSPIDVDLTVFMNVSRVAYLQNMTNVALLQDQSTSNDTDLSSSNMISFELSNGHPYETNVPNLMDDDQYVEYPLDDLAGFPCSVEEEERVSLINSNFHVV